MKHSARGLSPLARGNRDWQGVGVAKEGPIPARAGQPSPVYVRLRGDGVYPRSRGATRDYLSTQIAGLGLSPLARGNPLSPPFFPDVAGPIPARAGQPTSPRCSPPAWWAYPRSRGATPSSTARQSPRIGLSPLARGNPHNDRILDAGRGPIPARAGQPSFAIQIAGLRRAYPRSRGATSTLASSAVLDTGLSPLARGNRPDRAAAPACAGPIPARAGQPRLPRSSARRWRAYPRSRGATIWMRHRAARLRGLSPLARGNRRRSVSPQLVAGPIPARAGQPRTSAGSRDWQRAYPRSRGATKSWMLRWPATWGLSPLARGNQTPSIHHNRCKGPIPARAGQPLARQSRALFRRAYPRSRGATFRALASTVANEGLSPLARGNPSALIVESATPGPIPARAGQPGRRNCSGNAAAAYPRSRGATEDAFPFLPPVWGLSPLARGNPSAMALYSASVGPIPARAGQPMQHQQESWLRRAYPRSRGATVPMSLAGGWPLGLSPLARGNRLVRDQIGLALGPIPARAGQPG